MNKLFVSNFVNPQLSLTESEISKIGTIKVEGIINPTNAEMDLKDGVGEDDSFTSFFNLFSHTHLSSCCIHLWLIVPVFQVTLWRKLEAESS